MLIAFITSKATKPIRFVGKVPLLLCMEHRAWRKRSSLPACPELACPEFIEASKSRQLYITLCSERSKSTPDTDHKKRQGPVVALPSLSPIWIGYRVQKTIIKPLLHQGQTQ